MAEKSTVDEIRARFDADVERFSNLETGQSATIDAPLAMELVTQAAAAVWRAPDVERGAASAAPAVLDVGCGAGNYSLKVLEKLPTAAITLVDLSRPMLERATDRLRAAGCKAVEAIQGDIREIPLPPASFDIILAAAVLHHLRTDAEWEAVFKKFAAALRPGGSLWIFDLVDSDSPPIRELLWRQYADYLKSMRGEEYKDEVFAYIDREDTPRSVTYQLDLLRQVGITEIEILHKHACFAAFGGIKPGRSTQAR
jgi:tRNA (cmo5U34)-methyltransferase